MEFQVGDLIIATKLNGKRNGWINGDIIQIIKKRRSNSYSVKIVYKIDGSSSGGENCMYGWGLGNECEYFELM